MAKTSTHIGREVAEASRATTGKQRRGYPSALIASAQQLERLKAKRRKLKKDLRHIEADIKHEKKMLRAMAGAEEGEL